jgi:hypothetical protein
MSHLFRLSSAPAEVERLTGSRVSIKTVYRWQKVGICGARLRVVHCGGAMHTKASWLLAFFDDITKAKRPEE